MNYHLGRLSILLALIVAPTALFTGCLTMYTVAASQGYFSDSARIVRLHQAALQSDNVLVQVSIRRNGRRGTHSLLFLVPAADIGKTQYTRGEALTEDNLRLTAVQRGRVQAFGSSIPADALQLPLSAIGVRDDRHLDACLAALQPGIHVLAVTFDQKRFEQCSLSIPGDDFKIDKRTSVVLARVEAGGQVQSDEFTSFSLKRTKEPGWLLLTPLSAAGDLLTSPFQLIGLILSGGEI